MTTIENEMKVVAHLAGGKLLAGRIGPVGVVLFNQPEKRNAMSLQMWEGVCDALEPFAADDTLRVVVYAGAGGRSFVSGADISEFASKRRDEETRAEYARIVLKARARMLAFPKPSIACVQGYCLGAGVGAALQADLRVASGDAVFGIPVGRMGVAYNFENMERLVAAVGLSTAKLMLYTAKRFDAAQAHAMGLVDQVAAGDVGRDCIELAQTIAGNAPLALRAARFSAEQVLLPAEQRDTATMGAHIRRCLESADHREGRDAFLHKRPPAFIGA